MTDSAMGYGKQGQGHRASRVHLDTDTDDRISIDAENATSVTCFTCIFTVMENVPKA